MIFTTQMTKNVRLFAAAVMVVPVFTVPAHAYIDPGTASIVLQSIIGAIAAAGLFFRTHILSWYYRIFPGRGKQEKPQQSGDHANDAG